jgi:CheY-like chemotaxis protein
MEKRILIVDDDQEARIPLAAALRRQGYRITACKSGFEALTRAKGMRPPHAVLLDLQMPRMGGRAFLAAWRRIGAMAGVPIILISAERALEKAAHALGAHAHLEKPLHIDRLLALLRRLDRAERRAAA